MGENDELDSLRNEVQACPSDTSKRYELGRMLQAKGCFEESLRQFEEIIRLEPLDHESLDAAGVLSFKCGDIEKSLRYSARATELFPASPDFLVNYGDVLAHCGRVAEARVAYRKALAESLPNEEAVFRAIEGLDRLET